MTSPPRFIRFVAAPATAALTLAAAVACQSGTPSGAGAATTTTPTGDAQILAIGRQYSQCVRDHGIPTFPDMVVVAGHLALPDGAEGTAGDQALRSNTGARDACAPILRALPAGAQKGQALTSQDKVDLVRFARCMRQHGVPEWPDPNAHGSFPIASTPLGGQLKSSRVLDAEQACRQYWSGAISEK